MKKIYLLKYIVVFFFTTCIYSQIPQNSNWWFGIQNLVKFNSDNTLTASTINSSTGFDTPIEGSAQVSDSNGNLLFFTDGVKLYRYNSTFGTASLVTDQLKGCISTGQSVTIIPKPNSSDIFYIVTLSGQTGTSNTERGLHYTVYNPYTNVISQLNVPLKDIDGTLINPTFVNKSEAMTSTTHSNNIDFWLLVHINNGNNSRILTFLVNQNEIGLNGYPTSYLNTTFFNNSSSYGTSLKVSKNNSKFAFATRQFGLYCGDFNNSTGSLNNMFQVISDSYLTYGVEFSPNSNILYYTKYYYTNNSKIFGYNLSNNTNTLITTDQNKEYYGLQIGVDNKIYIATPGIYEFSRIDNPDLLSSSMSISTIPLQNKCYYGLPSWVHYHEVISCTPLTLTTESNSTPFTYQNYSNITTQSNYNLNLTSQDITMKAEDFIVLKINSHIKSDSKFWAKIQPCGNTVRMSESEFNFEKINKDKISDQESEVIYPNPTEVEFNINSNDEITKLTIFSLEGKLVFEKSYDGLKHITTNVSHLNNGVYFINIYYKNGQKVIKKLIKK